MDGGSRTAIIIGVVIFIIIIIIVVVIFFFGFGSAVVVNNRPLQSPCLNNEQCAPGLTCSNGICLSPIGGACSTLSDCVAGSTACFQGVCVNTPLSNVGGIPPCIPGLIDQNGLCVSAELGPCQSDDDCLDGMKCRDGECVRRNRGFNKPCSSTEPCDFGFTCDFDDECDEKCKNGRNRNRRREGRCKIANNSVVPCMDDDQCLTGSECRHNRCVQKRKDCSQSSKSSDCDDSDCSESSECDKSRKSDSSSCDGSESSSKECKRSDKPSESNRLSNKRSDKSNKKSTTFDLSSSNSSNSRTSNLSSTYATISQAELKPMLQRSNLTSGIKLVRGSDDNESKNILSQKLINRLKTQSQ